MSSDNEYTINLCDEQGIKYKASLNLDKKYINIYYDFDSTDHNLVDRNITDISVGYIMPMNIVNTGFKSMYHNLKHLLYDEDHDRYILKGGSILYYKFIDEISGLIRIYVDKNNLYNNIRHVNDVYVHRTDICIKNKELYYVTYPGVLQNTLCWTWVRHGRRELCWDTYMPADNLMFVTPNFSDYIEKLKSKYEGNINIGFAPLSRIGMEVSADASMEGFEKIDIYNIYFNPYFRDMYIDLYKKEDEYCIVDRASKSFIFFKENAVTLDDRLMYTLKGINDYTFGFRGDIVLSDILRYIIEGKL